MSGVEISPQKQIDPKIKLKNNYNQKPPANQLNRWFSGGLLSTQTQLYIIPV